MDEVKHSIVNVFDEMYPDAHCELDFSNTFELLVAVILSAQTTDKSVNKVTKTLFKRFPSPKTFAQAELSDIEAEIKHLGLYKNKAKSLKQMSQTLVEEFNSEVPQTLEELMKLSGVGKKTANVVLSVAFNKPAFAVDTHVLRVSKRLGIANLNDSVLEVEKKLNAYFPMEAWNKLHHQMIFFGRYHCLSRNPQCENCKLKNICKNDNKSDKIE